MSKDIIPFLLAGGLLSVLGYWGVKGILRGVINTRMGPLRRAKEPVGFWILAMLTLIPIGAWLISAIVAVVRFVKP